MSRLVRNPEGESGAVAIIVTICLILLFTLVSLAIDLGFARADVRNNQTISDFGSIAAVDAIRSNGTYQDACRAAVDYVFANAEELTSGSAEHTAARATCASDPELQDLVTNGCEDETAPLTAPVVVTISTSPYTITFTTPVPDNDPAMTVEGQAINDEIDGGPCDRVKVSVVRQRDYIFGPVAGNISGNPAADAVAVYFKEQDPDEIASLIVLEQTACNTLTTNGANAGFMVTNNVVNGVTYPGRITSDSDGAGGSPPNNCTSNRYTIDPQSGVNRGTICAQGDVGSHALGTGHDGTSHPPDTGMANCVPVALGGAGAKGVGVTTIPRPTRYGRRSIDWLVNCQTGYPAYNTTGNQRYPFYGDTPACPMTYGPAETPLPPFLDNLRGELQSGALAGFQVISGNNACGNALTNNPTQTKIHVQCTFGGQQVPPSIDFTNVTHVVFDHRVPQQVTNLTVTGDVAQGGALVYFRDGGLDRANSGNTTTMTNVFAYVDQATGSNNNPPISTNGGLVTWSSVRRTFVNGLPELHAQCDPLATLPTAACFAPLALWSNSTFEHSFGGNGASSISGSYFIPNAHVVLGGSGTASFRDAQFFGRTMVASGNGFVTLTPNPETNVPPPEINFGLIR